MSLRCYLLVALAVLGGATPVCGISVPSGEELSLKVVLQEKDIAPSDRLIGETLQALLSDNEAGLVLAQDAKRFFEIYFDTPERTFLNKNGFVFYQAEEYLTKKKKKRKYHERVLFNSGSNETLQLEVRHYSKQQAGEGKHPLFSLVKRKQRPELLTALSQAGVKHPLRLKSIFQVAKNTHSWVLSSDGQEILSIRNSFFTGMRSRNEAVFGLITVDINQKNMDWLGATQQKIVRNFLVQLEKNGDRVAPEEKDYKMIFKQMEKKIMLFPLLLRYPGIVNFLYAIAIGCVGVLLIMFFYRKKRSDQSSIR